MHDLLYATLAAARRRWYERHPEAQRRLRQPVISVGNLSVGGTGKTPLVAQIADWLVAQGERPSILSRGYKRRVVADGVTVVSDGSTVSSGLDVAGDEPLMLARKVPSAVVCVCKDRFLAGVIAERVLGASVHILDDGFQHVQLARDFDILVTSPGEIGTEHVLPRGRLRESRGAAARAHFVVVVGGDQSTARAEAWELGVSGFSGARRQLMVGHVPETSVAVAGVGQPGQFFAMLRHAGITPRATLAFPDHHHYTRSDLERIHRTCTTSGVATVVTTEKDAVRLGELGTLPFATVALPMRLELDDWSGLILSLQQALTNARAAA